MYMRLSNLWVARVLGAQNSQAPRSSCTSAASPVAHTILNNRCEDEWTKISGWGLTILFSQFCACEGGDTQFPNLNFVPAYGGINNFHF